MSYTHYYKESGLFHGSSASVMNTQLDVLLVGNDGDHLQKVWSAIEGEVFRLHHLLNRFDPNSPIFAINQTGSHHPVHLDDELWNILCDCRKYYEYTLHYFDVTLQRFDQILLDESDHSLFFFSESLKLDLGGYAKGYTSSRLETLIRGFDIEHALVNFGNSSILGIGKHPFGDYWPVGIDNPYTGKRLVDIKLYNESLSVSGNMPSNPRHIVNPQTGVFIEDAKVVSVKACNPVDAEVLSTTFMIAEEHETSEIEARFEKHEKQLYKL